MQSGSNEMVSSIHTSFTAAQDTQTVAQKAGDELVKISASISRITEKTITVASATEEQALVSKEVDNSILTETGFVLLNCGNYLFY